MPTYDYACSACGHRFERFESINEDGAKGCPKCNKRKARRQLGMGAGFIFKGAGFYTTDSRPPAAKEADVKKPAVAEKPLKKKEEKEPKK